MAKYSIANNQIFSGTIGGSKYTRQGVVGVNTPPTNTFSVYKQFQIDAMTAYAMAWQELDQGNMLLWHNYYLNNVDTLGKLIHSNGAQAFISCNVNLAIVNNSFAVVYVDYPPVNRLSEAIIITSVTCNGSRLELNSVPVVNGYTVEVYATSNLSPGIFRPIRNKFILIGIADITGGYADITGMWSSRYAVFITGSKIFIRLKNINESGVASVITAGSCIIT